MTFFRARVLGNGEPLPDVRIYRAVGSKWELVGKTDAEGYQIWDIDPDILPLKLLFEPKHGFWAKHVKFCTAEGETEVHLEALPREGPTAWWHACLGSSAGQPASGRDVRVGIVDTGVGPCACLRQVVAAGAWTDGDFSPGKGACLDISNHGTHVAGLVAARACEKEDYVGVAPGVTAIMARVFTENPGEAGHDDVANAIEALVREHQVHLINLSLGGAEPRAVERDAILDALDVGTLIIAASGNAHAAVEYPAAYEEVVAVTALGRFGEGNEMAKSGTYVAGGHPFEDAEGLYPADFSCHGPEVTCMAPGVDIISTVPSKAEDCCAFAAMTGTSMAAPIVTGTLAILLGRDEEYLQMEPCRERAEHALAILRRSCRDLGFPEEWQGAGLPTLP